MFENLYLGSFSITKEMFVLFNVRFEIIRVQYYALFNDLETHIMNPLLVFTAHISKQC